jgi:hypothetical protein
MRAVFKPPRSVHGSPWTSPEVHWLQAPLAHDWRTITTLDVFSEDNALREQSGPEPSAIFGPERLGGRSRGPSVLVEGGVRTVGHLPAQKVGILDRPVNASGLSENR